MKMKAESTEPAVQCRPSHSVSVTEDEPELILRATPRYSMNGPRDEYTVSEVSQTKANTIRYHLHIDSKYDPYSRPKKRKQTQRHRILIAMEGWGGWSGSSVIRVYSHRNTQHCKSTVFPIRFLKVHFQYLG